VRLITPTSRCIYARQVNLNGPKASSNDTLLPFWLRPPDADRVGRTGQGDRAGADPNEIREIVIDVTRMMQKGDWRNNLLQEGDITSRRRRWAGCRLRLQELLFPTVPLLNAYTYPANVNNAMRTYSDYDWSTGESGGRGVYYGGGSGSGLGTQGW
jgi:hypothetical protein